MDLRDKFPEGMTDKRDQMVWNELNNLLGFYTSDRTEQVNDKPVDDSRDPEGCVVIMEKFVKAVRGEDNAT